MPPVRPLRFIFVHGSHTGAWIWDDVVARVRDAGHNALALDLAGYGTNRHLPASLAANAHIVERALQSSEIPAVLVGHSMGGFAITQGASLAPENVALLVYLAAFVPLNDETLADCASRDLGSAVRTARTIDQSGRFATLPEASVREIFFADGPGETQADWARRFVPDPLLPPGEASRFDEAVISRIPALYLSCAASKAITPEYQHAMQRRRAFRATQSIEAGHMVMLEQPQALTALLVDHAVGIPLHTLEKQS